MAARATIAKGYRLRLGIIALALLAFTAWAAYDGFVKYPELIERSTAYQQIVDEHPQDYPQQWEQHAREQGWPTDKPKDKTKTDVWFQYGIMIIALPLGLYFLAVFLRSGGRWVESTEDGLRTHDGRAASWDRIKDIDKSRWKSKGIAVVSYEDAGKTRRITLDDWKFQREPTAAILSEVEARTGLGDGTGSAEASAEATSSAPPAEPDDAKPSGADDEPRDASEATATRPS